MYRICSFNNLPSIAVLCRGLSLRHIDSICDKFKHCFIVGQFDKALAKLQCLKGKNIVHIINKSSIQSNRAMCKDFNIKDLQCNFDGWATRPMSRQKLKLFRRITIKNSWMTVHAAPLGIRERRGNVDWCTTGIFAVDLAAFLRPKEIIVVGLDFYSSKYFAKEEVHVPISKNKRRKKEMMTMLDRIIQREPVIGFSIYTSSDYGSNYSNATVYHV